MDTTDNTEFNAGISQLYDEKDPVKLAGLFSSLVSQLKPIHLVDNLGLSLFQHFCILSDRLEPAPEAMRDIMRLFTNLAKGAKAPAELFAFFNMSAIPKPILAKAPTSEKPKRKSKVGPSKPWGGPALHYLAKRKRYATLETVLAAWSEFPEGTSSHCHRFI